MTRPACLLLQAVENGGVAAVSGGGVEAARKMQHSLASSRVSRYVTFSRDLPSPRAETVLPVCDGIRPNAEAPRLPAAERHWAIKRAQVGREDTEVVGFFVRCLSLSLSGERVVI
ncbi:hypothetical protein B9Z55_008552 [Caenorhabditis nigoni]|uniref:Uncharacterized protein n=1 Tax=Caenorhabditis nigoni TaxID=1611254 RepID=A0A2G5UNE5_9PELO|nr:hypothetical protein B9Z55_008552 [Caenorhabditis nigoni]